MSKRIEVLSKAIFNGMGSGNEIIQKNLKDLHQIKFIDFLIYNYRIYSPSYLDLLMFGSKKYWENFSLNQWKEILKKSANNELSVQYCISFLYKYICIDSLKLFENIEGIEIDLKFKFLNYFRNNKGLLAVFERISTSELAKFNLTLSSFDEIRERLIKEGASKADKVDSTKIDLSSHDGASL